PAGGAVAGDVRAGAEAGGGHRGRRSVGRLASRPAHHRMARSGRAGHRAPTARPCPGPERASHKASHLLAAMVWRARAVIAQRDLAQKTNETPQPKPLLGRGPTCAGRSSRPTHARATPKPPATWSEEKHADYLFTSVKDNQPTLFAGAGRAGLAGHADRAPP